VARREQTEGEQLPRRTGEGGRLGSREGHAGKRRRPRRPRVVPCAAVPVLAVVWVA
jgi:hypothetical protein